MPVGVRLDGGAGSAQLRRRLRRDGMLPRLRLRQLREPALGDGLECSKRRLPASQASRVASYSCCLRSFVEPRISSNLRLPSQMDQIISVVGEVYSMQLEVDQAITAVMVRAAHRIRRGASSLAAPNSCALFCICRRRTR